MISHVNSTATTADFLARCDGFIADILASASHPDLVNDEVKSILRTTLGALASL